MALAPIYWNVGPTIYMAGAPMSAKRAGARLAYHAEAARTGTNPALREVDASLRDELLIAMARAVGSQLEILTRDVEDLAAKLRAPLPAHQRPGADNVIPFQRRS